MLATTITALLCITGVIRSTGEKSPNELIDQMAIAIEQNYVYPEKGEQAAQMLRENTHDGLYDNLSGQELAQRLRADLLSLTHDRHFGVRALPDDWSPPSEDEQAQIVEPAGDPYGFSRVERLDGNIGYIKLDGFNRADLIGPSVEAAMRLVQGSNALIFDLRGNGGGDPDAVALISSYLFDPAEPVHLNSLYSRPTDTTTEYWTHNRINTDLTMPDTPVYVLTSSYTFSAAEEFTYNLKNLDRATIVGETTGGGAHPVDPFVFRDDQGHQLMLILPTAKAVSPITGTNWEGVGVEPDIKVSAPESLDAVRVRVLEQAAAEGDAGSVFALAVLKADADPIQISQRQQQEYEGDYGEREIRIRDARLMYRRRGISEFRPLICVEHDRFVIDGVDGFIMEFERDESGNIRAIVGRYLQGHSDRSERVDG